jgi:hypothetical protein
MTATTTAARGEVAVLAAELEELWQAFDTLFAGFKSNEWARKHGKHWSYADVPYHLAYFDRECINVMALGAAAPPSVCWLMRSEAEVNTWNARMFVRRPAGQIVAESVADMRASRDLVRGVLASLTDADLAGPAWNPCFGWMTLREGIVCLIGHTFNHLVEARLRLRRSTTSLSPAVTHRALGFYLGLMERFMDTEQAAIVGFTAVMAFTDPLDTAWTIRVEEGQCRVFEARAAGADLVMMQSPEAFIGMATKARNPLALILTGQVIVKGWRALGTFGKLFPAPGANPERTWPVQVDLALAAD